MYTCIWKLHVYTCVCASENNIRMHIRKLHVHTHLKITSAGPSEKKMRTRIHKLRTRIQKLHAHMSKNYMHTCPCAYVDAHVHLYVISYLTSMCRILPYIYVIPYLNHSYLTSMSYRILPYIYVSSYLTSTVCIISYLTSTVMFIVSININVSYLIQLHCMYRYHILCIISYYIYVSYLTLHPCLIISYLTFLYHIIPYICVSYSILP